MPVSTPQVDVASILTGIMSTVPWWAWAIFALVLFVKARNGERKRRRRASKSAIERGAIGEGKVAAALKRHKYQAIHDVLLPSREGAVTQVDHIALAGGMIVSIETKNWSGSIYGRAQDSHWTQVLHLGHKERAFNPILQSANHVKAIEVAGDYRNVRSIVVFTSKARFPTGQPDGVIHIDDLPKWLSSVARDYPPNPYAVRAWGRLQKHHATCDRKRLSKIHMETVESAQSRRHRRAA